VDIPAEPEPHYIYVIAADSAGPVKLGISFDPDRRLRELQTASPVTLNIHHREPVNASLVKTLEKILHRDLAHHRRRGEWFGLSVEEAIKQVAFTMIRYADETDLVEKFRVRRI
jgi:hypothetical protein